MRDRLTEEQLRQVYAETISALYGYASRRCGGERALAEDITQEVWLRAVREWRRQGVPTNPLAWLITVARNLIHNHLRRRVGISLDAVSPADVRDAVERDAVADSGEIATVVGEALLRLTTAEARLLEAFYFERLKMSQLAELYAISERAVEGRLRRARQRLRHELEITLKAAGEPI